MRKLRIAVIVLLTAVLLGQEGKPLSKRDIADLMSGGVSDRKVISWVEKYGIDFEATPEYLQTLRTLSASDELLKVIYSASVKRSAPTTEPSSTQENEKNRPTAENKESPANGKAGNVEALEAGVYYKGANGWVKLELITMANMEAHIGKSLFFGTKPQMAMTFRHAEALAQITDRRPTFYINNADYLGQSARDILLVRLDRKKDYRAVEYTSEGGSMFTVKADKKAEITVTRVAEHVFTVAPKTDLQPGEYLLTFGLESGGYDFGITAAKQ